MITESTHHPNDPATPELAVGQPCRVLLGFDTAATVNYSMLDADGSGQRYNYAPASLPIDVFFGGLGPIHFSYTGL